MVMRRSNIEIIREKLEKIHDMVYENNTNIAVIRSMVESQNSRIKKVEDIVQKHSARIAEARGGLLVLGIIVSLITIAKLLLRW